MIMRQTDPGVRAWWGCWERADDEPQPTAFSWGAAWQAVQMWRPPSLVSSAAFYPVLHC